MGVLMGIEDSITHLKNVDFGRNYAYDAITEWRNGNYLQAAIYELDATSEMVLDLCFAYVGAQIVNVFIIDSLDFVQAVKAYYGNTKPKQVHHFATNKNKIYTIQVKNIVKKYGLDLDSVWNKELMPHQGRHPNEYHEYILDICKNLIR